MGTRIYQSLVATHDGMDRFEQPGPVLPTSRFPVATINDSRGPAPLVDVDKIEY